MIDADYKIIDKLNSRLWWGSKIYAKKYGIFPPEYILHYSNPFDRDSGTRHIKAIDLNKYDIECLTKKAYVELAHAKREYEKLRKT